MLSPALKVLSYSRQDQAELSATLPDLTADPTLGRWLYLETFQGLFQMGLSITATAKDNPEEKHYMHRKEQLVIESRGRRNV